MARKKKSSTGRRNKNKKSSPRSQPRRPSEEELQGPPPREATIMRSDQERRFTDRLAIQTHTGPALAGGDLDADWARSASVGEESVGGSVPTPDQDIVDDLGKALGVPRAPEEEFRTSAEILERRDRYRWDDEETTER